MSILILAEHDGKTLSPPVRHAVTAATQIGGEVHILIAGQGAKSVAEQAAAMESARALVEKREQLLAAGKAKLVAIRQKGVDLQRQRGVGRSPHGADAGRAGSSSVARRRAAPSG